MRIGLAAFFVLAAYPGARGVAGRVRSEIEAAYVKALNAFREAKSIEDLDEINRSFDTGDVDMKGNISLIPLKETWKKTAVGWKRQIHQKFPVGEPPK